MKTIVITLIVTSVCLVHPVRQSAARNQQTSANAEFGISLYPEATYSPELTQRLLEKNSPTWLLTRVYRTDHSIKEVNKFFKLQAQKLTIESQNPMVKGLLRDNWEVERNYLQYSPKIFGAGLALRTSAPALNVEYSFGIIAFSDHVVRVHLTSPYPSAAYHNRLVEGTMIILIKERLTDEIAPDDEKAYSGQDVTRKVRVRSKPHPEYATGGVGGTVVLRVVFTASGKVANIRVVSDLPGGFTEASVKAARKIKFEPAIKDGRYVSQHVQLEYNFCP